MTTTAKLVRRSEVPWGTVHIRGRPERHGYRKYVCTIWHIFGQLSESEDESGQCLAGNISRVLAGKVPAHRAAYGYAYRAEKIFEARTGRAKVLHAWWEVDELGSDGEPIWGTTAWVVIQIFIWLGYEGRTAYWVAGKQELGIRAPCRTSWAPKTVINIAYRRCYTREAEYNANGRVPNPDKPLGDLTLGIKRTLLRPKPDSEKVVFEAPACTTKEQWLRANSNLRDRPWQR